MRIDKSKALVLLTVVAVAAILGSMVLIVYASDSGEESICLRNLTDEQVEAIRQKVQEMREAGASQEEIRAEITVMLQEWSVEAPECHGPRVQGLRNGMSQRVRHHNNHRRCRP